MFKCYNNFKVPLLFSIILQEKHEMIEFKLEAEFIELAKLLKTLHIAVTGGHAKILVNNGEVQVNGQVEFRKRVKLRDGDIVRCMGKEVVVVS